MALLQRLPHFSRKPLLTELDIGSHSIKLVRLQARQGGYQLANLGVMPLPTRSIADHTSVDEGSAEGEGRRGHESAHRCWARADRGQRRDAISARRRQRRTPLSCSSRKRRKAKEKNEKFKTEDRVHCVAPAIYMEGSKLDCGVKANLDFVASRGTLLDLLEKDRRAKAKYEECSHAERPKAEPRGAAAVRVPLGIASSFRRQ